jgi:CBS-domain-containing membrane protein
MNKQLVYLRDGDRVEIAKQPIIDFGITAVPVLDDAHRPVGVVSLRDLVEHGVRATRSTEPVAMVAVDAPITAAAKVLAEANVHHPVVVDSQGTAVGMISALDVVRGLTGLPPLHPGAIGAFASPAAGG